MKTQVENDMIVLHGGTPSNNSTSGHGLSPYVYHSLELPCVSNDLKNTLLTLLSNSLSLDKDEKLRVLNAMPSLIEFQVFALIETLEEEAQKWSDLLYKEFIKNSTKQTSSFSTANDLIHLKKNSILEWSSIAKELQASLFKRVH